MTEFLTPQVLTTLLTVLGSGLVAIVVALIATTREVRQANMRRHFAFADDRSDMYAAFLRQATTAWAAWFEARQNMSAEIKRPKLLRVAKEQAKELDIQMDVLRITTPRSVSGKCGQINGMVQQAVIDIEFGGPSSTSSSQFEAARNAMLDAMRADIELIEGARDRKEYVISARKL